MTRCSSPTWLLPSVGLLGASSTQNFTYVTPGAWESSSVTADRPSMSSSHSVESSDLTSTPAS